MDWGIRSRIWRVAACPELPAAVKTRGIIEPETHDREESLRFSLCLPFVPAPQRVYSPAELKTMQEVITLIVFAGFTAVYFKEPLTPTQGAGFALIAFGALLVFRG